MVIARDKGFTPEAIESIIQYVGVLTPVFSIVKELPPPSNGMTREELAPLASVPFESTFPKVLESTLANLDAGMLEKAVSFWLSMLKMANPSLEDAKKRLHLLTTKSDEEHDVFIAQLTRKFLEAIDAALASHPVRVERLFQRVNEIKAGFLPFRDHLQKSEYQKLGLSVRNPSWKDVIEAIECKQDLLFDGEGMDITNTMKRLASDLANLIEEHMKLILFTTYGLERIASGNKASRTASDELGSYARVLGIDRRDKIDFIDYRNAIHHRTFQVEVDKAHKAIKFSLHIERKNRFKQITFSREKQLDLAGFLSLFKHVQTIVGLYEAVFESDMKAEEPGRELDVLELAKSLGGSQKMKDQILGGLKEFFQNPG